MKGILRLALCGTLAAVLTNCSSNQATSDTTQIAKNTTPVASEAKGPVELRIVAPTEGQVVPSGDVSVSFDLKNYELQPNGQHIHVILDNEAYQPCYGTTEPFILKDVKPGVHTIRAFPSRAWHESIKDPKAFASVTFYVKEKVGMPPMDLDHSPLLTYSRPKGKYEGEKAKKILFDFWVKNAELAPDKYKVKYRLDHQKPEILTEWKPTYFENLKKGKHKLTIELLAPNGKRAAGIYNKTTREFEVDPDSQGSDNSAHH